MHSLAMKTRENDALLEEMEKYVMTQHGGNSFLLQRLKQLKVNIRADARAAHLNGSNREARGSRRNRETDVEADGGGAAGVMRGNPVPQKKTDAQLMDQVEVELEQYRVGREVVLDGNYKIDNTADCLRSIRQLVQMLNSAARHAVAGYAVLGGALANLKSRNPKNYLELLRTHGIGYSRSYCAFLIQLSILVAAHPRLLQFGAPIHFMRTNMRIIAEIAKKNSW